jgi:hypothetical protein
MEFNVTTDHDEIRTWIEEHGGMPSVRDKRGTQRGVLDVCFDEFDDEHDVISWDEFFDTFDTLNMEFRYVLKSDGDQMKEFAYSFVNVAEEEGRRDEDHDTEMPEDDVPLENVVPSAPARPSPDAPNDSMFYG